MYDTMTKLNWSSDVRTHRIGVVIDQLLAKDWEEGLPVPKAEPEDDCVVRRIHTAEHVTGTNFTDFAMTWTRNAIHGNTANSKIPQLRHFRDVGAANFHE